MVVSPFLLVFWPSEKRYSKVSRDSIVDETLRKEDDSVLRSLSSISLMWNRKTYNGKIVNCGSREFINDQLLSNAPEEEYEEPSENLEVTEDSAQPIRKSKKRKRADAVVAGIDKVLGSIENKDLSTVNVENVIANGSDYSELALAKAKITQLEELLAAANENATKYKNRAKTVKAELKSLKRHQIFDIDIGLGVVVRKDIVERIKFVSPSATIFARNLFREVFSKDELMGKSLFGRGSNANKDIQIKPSVDESKRNAVIAYTVEYFKPDESQSLSRQKDWKSYVLVKIHKTLGEYIREVNRERGGSDEY